MREGILSSAEAAGEAISAAVGAFLLHGFEDVQGYTLRSRGEDRVWCRRELDGGCLHKAEGWVLGPLELVEAMVREPDRSGLAGKLAFWHPVRLSPYHEIVAYQSRLPWPWRDRHFRVVERYGRLADGSAVILGRDATADDLALLPPDAQGGLVARGPTAPGSVLLSAYHLSRQGERVRVRRVIRIELGLWGLPRRLLPGLLSAIYLADFGKMRAGVGP